MITQDIHALPPAQPVPVDLLLLSQNPPVHVAQLMQFFSFRQVVIDNSNASWKTVRWKEECRNLGISCFTVAEQGAFVLNLY